MAKCLTVVSKELLSATSTARQFHKDAAFLLLAGMSDVKSGLVSRVS